MMPRGRPNTIDQFWAWVPLDNPDKRICTLWQGPRDKEGYGLFHNKLGFSRYAHRVLNEILHGKITDGSLVLHRCDNPPCMRDGHHWRGTDLDNAMDKEAKRRVNHSKGEKHGMATLKDIEILAIRNLANKGISNQIIADAFKISRDLVYRIVTRRIWTHI
jgi:hypothetical protein